MSDKIQQLHEISPMTAGGAASAKDAVQAEYEQGKKHLERGDTGLAAASLHNALVGFEERGDKGGMANAANQLGNTCIKRGDYDKALEHFRRAEEICRQLDDPLSLRALSKQFILVYTELGRYKEAIDRCLDLLDEYQANNDPNGAVAILERLAEIYICAEEKEKAADAYRTIASIHKNFRHEKTATAYQEKAETLLQG